MENHKITAILLLILGLSGIGIASYYAWSHGSSGGNGYCTSSGAASACQNSYDLGWITIPLVGRVHLSWIAIGFFSLQFILTAIYMFNGGRSILKTMVLLYSIGTLLIPYLAYLQVKKLSSVCIYCASMYIAIIAALLVGIHEIRRLRIQ